LTAASRPREAPNGGGVIIHDDAAVENEECIMNNAAPVRSALAIPSRTPPRAR
jgi:hypothetical protein